MNKREFFATYVVSRVVVIEPCVVIQPDLTHFKERNQDRYSQRKKRDTDPVVMNTSESLSTP